MTTTAYPAKITTFFQLLEQTPDLDMRDNRGKRHLLALVLTGLVAALCCGRDGNLSRRHGTGRPASYDQSIQKPA